MRPKHPNIFPEALKSEIIPTKNEMFKRIKSIQIHSLKSKSSLIIKLLGATRSMSLLSKVESKFMVSFTLQPLLPLPENKPQIIPECRQKLG
ncbi:CLUMA_CG013936, isoform A [Clunio marinus]|uniref:CLUMA_CG013936, isoform A n=1 Tax=Clunio marinus TaxID=568069 RepID=A0A1J1IM86_9DIPT|nr:CLUMA_CG013936, isoform A [Clunio marinus]